VVLYPYVTQGFPGIRRSGPAEDQELDQRNAVNNVLVNYS